MIIIYYERTNRRIPKKYQETQNEDYKSYHFVFCQKCKQSYKLPKHSYSWRCKRCHKFNDLKPDCNIL